MGILKPLGGRLQIAVLLIMALSIFALVGCGDSAPSSAVMTVKLHNSYTDGVLNTKVYRVTMTDAAGVPMNGLKVNLYGTFTAGSAITLQGNTATAAPGSLASIKSSIELNGSGIQDFFLSAPTTNTIPIPTPVITGVTELSGTGSLIFGTTYCYGVSALDAQPAPPGQTLLSSVSTIVSAVSGSSNAIQINWTPVIGASAYNVYGGSGAACPATATLLATVPTSTTVYIDRTGSGSGVTAGAFGSAGTAVNTVSGTIDVQSGSLSEVLNVGLP